MTHTDIGVSLAVALALAGAGAMLQAQTPAAPADPNRRFLEVADFRLEGGVVLPTARIAYATFGTLNAARDNAVLLTTSYGADYHVYDFVVGPGKAFDPATVLRRDDRDVRQRRVVVAQQHAGPARRSRLPGDRDSRQRRGVAPGARASRRDPRARRRRLLDGRGAVVPVGGVASRRSWTRSSRGAARPRPIRTASCGSKARFARSPPTRRSPAGATPRRRRTAWPRGRRTGRPGCGRRSGGGASSTSRRAATVDEVIAARIARDAIRDANNLITQARAWQRHDVGDTPGFGGDHEKALASIARPRALHAVRDRPLLPGRRREVRAAVPEAGRRSRRSRRCGATRPAAVAIPMTPRSSTRRSPASWRSSALEPARNEAADGPRAASSRALPPPESEMIGWRSARTEGGGARLERLAAHHAVIASSNSAARSSGAGRARRQLRDAVLRQRALDQRAGCRRGVADRAAGRSAPSAAA